MHRLVCVRPGVYRIVCDIPTLESKVAAGDSLTIPEAIDLMYAREYARERDVALHDFSGHTRLQGQHGAEQSSVAATRHVRILAVTDFLRQQRQQAQAAPGRRTRGDQGVAVTGRARHRLG